MKRPLVVLTVSYCLGIILAHYLRVNFWVNITIGLAVLVALGCLKNNNYIFLASIFLLALITGMLNLKNIYILPRQHIRNLVHYKDKSFYNLTGFVDSPAEWKNNQLEFIFAVNRVQQDQLSWLACGKVLVKLDFARKLDYGDNLTISGSLSRPGSFSLVSGSYKDFLARQGIYLIMRLKDSRGIISLPGQGGYAFIRYSLWLRQKLESVINQNLAPLPAAILSAMVLGQKQNIPWLVNSSMIKSGTVHILVVSGFNVSIVAFIFSLLFKIMRLGRKIRIILVLFCLCVYCFLTGASNPVIRATVMGVIFLLAYLFKRDPDIYNSLASAALFILLINPSQLFDLGFQLSFMSVLAIVYLYPKFKALICPDKLKIKIWRLMLEGFLVSSAAWLGTLVIIALNFRIIAPVTVLANIFIVPLATVITLCGFVLVASGLICPVLASIFSLPTTMLINLLLTLNEAVIKLPFAYFYL